MRRIQAIWALPFVSFVLGYYITHMFFHTQELVTPSFIGKPVAHAIKLATQLGLNVRLHREQIDPDLPDGMVLGQIPKSLKMIKPNQHVFLTLSRRPTGIVVPEVLDIDKKTVIARCKKLGIPLETFWLTSYAPKNLCLAQSPQPGQTAKKRRLKVYLSAGKNQLYVFPLLKGRLITEVETFLEREGIKVELFYNKKAKHDNDKTSFKVLDQKPMAGSIVDKSKKLYVQLQAG